MYYARSLLCSPNNFLTILIEVSSCGLVILRVSKHPRDRRTMIECFAKLLGSLIFQVLLDEFHRSQVIDPLVWPLSIEELNVIVEFSVHCFKVTER